MIPLKKQFRAIYALILSAILFVPTACQQDDIVPVEERELGTGTSPGERTAFTITSSNITETSNGVKFTGKLGTKDENGEDFEVGEGEFEVVVGPDGEVESITGSGKPKFPNIGVLSELLKEFVFSEIESRIEYLKGSAYKLKYSTDIPLDDETKYLHFQVLNESRDGAFELRSKVNTVIYNFSDLYIDPTDPSIFFKMQLWKPSIKPNQDGVIGQFWKRVASNLIKLGKEVKEFKDAPGMIVGISNQAKFKTTEYDFSITNKDDFKDLYGFDRFEELNAHLYLKLKGIPIPETVVLQLSGEMFIHQPTESITPSLEEIKQKRRDAFLDWFREGEDHGKMATFAGSMDPGGNALSMFILGALPQINDIVGKDIFNDDLDIDIVGATLQYQIPRLDQIGNGTSFLRFGGQIRKPLIADLFGEDIKKFIISTPASDDFIYFNVGPKLEDASFFIESAPRLVIPFYGEANFLKSHFLINKDGISFSGKTFAPLGPLTLSREITGSISKEGYAFETIVDKDITLPNGIIIASRELNVGISSTDGLTVEGDVEMPFGLGESHITGQLSKDGLSLSGSLKAGTAINLGNGLLLPTADMTFSTSSDPSKGISFAGKLELPHGIGFVDVEGELTKDGFSFTGITNKEINFGGVNLLSKSGELTISNTNGIYFESSFAFGAGFGDQHIEGSITAQEIKLTGNFNRQLPIGGHTFTFTNGTITASTLTGVVITGKINLYVFNVNVSGKMTALNSFSLTGSVGYNGTYFKSTIAVAVTPSKVNLSGNGKVYGLLGNELYSGVISFKPNWSTKTIQACYNGNICVGL